MKGVDHSNRGPRRREPVPNFIRGGVWTARPLMRTGLGAEAFVCLSGGVGLALYLRASIHSPIFLESESSTTH
eukprot:9115201-Pyramimonas_sp.AAC.1